MDARQASTRVTEVTHVNDEILMKRSAGRDAGVIMER